MSDEPMSLVAGARYLGIGKNAIYGYVSEGKIAVITYPERTRVKVTRAALDAFRESCTGTLHGPFEETTRSQQSENAGHSEVSRRISRRREAELDQVFARKA